MEKVDTLEKTKQEKALEEIQSPSPEFENFQRECLSKLAKAGLIKHEDIEQISAEVGAKAKFENYKDTALADIFLGVRGDDTRLVSVTVPDGCPPELAKKLQATTQGLDKYGNGYVAIDIKDLEGFTDTTPEQLIRDIKVLATATNAGSCTGRSTCVYRNNGAFIYADQPSVDTLHAFVLMQKLQEISPEHKQEVDRIIYEGVRESLFSEHPNRVFIVADSGTHTALVEPADIIISDVQAGSSTNEALAGMDKNISGSAKTAEAVKASGGSTIMAAISHVIPCPLTNERGEPLTFNEYKLLHLLKLAEAVEEATITNKKRVGVSLVYPGKSGVMYDQFDDMVASLNVDYLIEHAEYLGISPEKLKALKAFQSTKGQLVLNVDMAQLRGGNPDTILTQLEKLEEKGKISGGSVQVTLSKAAGGLPFSGGTFMTQKKAALMSEYIVEGSLDPQVVSRNIKKGYLPPKIEQELEAWLGEPLKDDTNLAVRIAGGLHGYQVMTDPKLEDRRKQAQEFVQGSVDTHIAERLQDRVDRIPYATEEYNTDGITAFRLKPNPAQVKPIDMKEIRYKLKPEITIGNPYSELDQSGKKHEQILRLAMDATMYEFVYERLGTQDPIKQQELQTFMDTYCEIMDRVVELE